MFVVNQEYRIVELNTDIDLPEEMIPWLKENFGNGSDGRWAIRYPNVYFANSKDHLLFTLRWS